MPPSCYVFFYQQDKLAIAKHYMTQSLSGMTLVTYSITAPCHRHHQTCYCGLWDVALLVLDIVLWVTLSRMSYKCSVGETSGEKTPGKNFCVFFLQQVHTDM